MFSSNLSITVNNLSEGIKGRAVAIPEPLPSSALVVLRPVQSNQVILPIVNRDLVLGVIIPAVVSVASIIEHVLLSIDIAL